MARAFLTSIDLNKNQLLNAAAQSLGSDPGTPTAGQFWFNSTGFVMKWYNGSAVIDPLARANHSGTALAATISNFDTQVRTSRIDQMATPTASVAFGSQKITGLATCTATGEAANWDYVNTAVQSAAAGIASKPPVRVVSVTNQAALTGLLTIDGVTLGVGDRVLLAGQSTASQNGTYVAASGAWSRTSPTTDPLDELQPGSMWLITEGTTYAGSQFRLATVGAIVSGTTALSIVQFGSGSAYTNGNGLSLAGGTFSVNPAASGGISVSGAGVALDTSIAARKYSVSIGDGSTTSFTVTHSLSTQDVVVMVRQASTPWSEVEADVAASTTSTCTVAFATAPTSNQYRVTVIG